MGELVVTRDASALASTVDVTAQEFKHGAELQWIKRHINKASMWGKIEFVNSMNTD